MMGGRIMTNIRWFVKLFPYFIVKKLCLGYNPDHAILRFNEHNQLDVDCFEVEPGIWIVKSARSELLRRKAQLENLISRIDDRLESIS